MPTSTSLTLGTTPALLVHEGSAQDAARAGTVLVFHGLRGSKETLQPELEHLARAGFLAVGLDNAFHGARRDEDWLRAVASADPRTSDAAWIDALERTAAELPAVLDALAADGLCGEGRVAVSGVSMGGYVAYAAPLRDRRVGLIAPVLGSPRWGDAVAQSPHWFAARFFPTAVFSQTAGLDEVVPPRDAREFHGTLTPHYAWQPDRLSYVEYPESGHTMPKADWERVWRNITGWCARMFEAPRPS